MAEIIKSFEEGGTRDCGDLLSKRHKRPDFKVGLMVCGYFEYWRMYPDGLKADVEADMAEVAARIERAVGPVVRTKLVDTLDAADEAGRMLAEARVDAVIVVEGTYVPDFMTLHALDYIPNASILLFSTQTAPDVDPASDYRHSLRNSGVIGVAQLSGTMRKLGRKYRTVVGAKGEARAYGKIAESIAAARAAASLREANIGVIGHVFRGMYDLELSKTFLKAAFGVNVIYIQASHLAEIWETVSQEAAIGLADALTGRFAARGVARDDVIAASRLALAMRALADDYALDGLCFLDQHYLQRLTRTSARLGASLLMENTGVSAACEGDLGGLVTMMLMRELSGKPALMGEWGEFDESTNSCFIIGHGIGTPDMAASDAGVTLTRTPEEWGFDGAGLNYELIMKPGPVTLAHIIELKTGYRLLVSAGESVAYPTLRYDELHALVRVKTPVREYLERVFDAGAAHHVIVGQGDMSASLKRVAELLGLELLSPDDY